MRNNSSHTFQIKRKTLKRDAFIFIDASEMCGYNFFSSFSFLFFFSFDPKSITQFLSY